jgi:hypothetical protein
MCSDFTLHHSQPLGVWTNKPQWQKLIVGVELRFSLAVSVLGAKSNGRVQDADKICLFEP